ncbi:DUF58 domain-containing protein [candidate division KSB1 bacterium]|nr:DUF58 domain-containing protein [candidate division KSB1 bacterium]
MSTEPLYRKYLHPATISRLANMNLRARLVVEGFITGLHRSPYHGFSVEFAEHRQYMPGDEIRHVDWKVYGKTDRFYVKQFEEETNLKCYILVDQSASMGIADAGKVSKFDYASYLAAALSYLMIHQRDAVGLMLFNERISRYLPPRSVQSYLTPLLGELENAKPAGAANWTTSLHQIAEQIKRRGLIIVLSDFLPRDLDTEPAQMLAGLKHFRHRKHEVLVFQILDPLDYRFDFRDDAIFQDVESGTQLPTQPHHLRAAVQKEIDEYLAWFKRQCRENQIDYTLMDTATDFDRALMQYLLKRKRLVG